MLYDCSKRLTDIAVSLVAIIVLSPLIVILAALIKLGSPGPVFYRGERAGRMGATFRILKFRTMVSDAERVGGFSTAIDDPRLTPTGRLLRKYKLDELPQFFNVLVGHMSLVGPRPQVLFYTRRYTGDELMILTVRPGITDLSSLYFVDMDAVLGTGNVEDRYREEIEPVKNQLRIRYVRERSYLLDLRIIVETAFKLFGIDNATGLRVSTKRFSSE